MSHNCIMATAGTVHIHAIPSEALSLYARAYAEFNLSRRNPRHPGILTRNTICPECSRSVGGDLVATELLRLVGEHEQQKDPLRALSGSLETWFEFQAQCQGSPA
jgi:hypothetical protein